MCCSLYKLLALLTTLCAGDVVRMETLAVVDRIAERQPHEIIHCITWTRLREHSNRACDPRIAEQIVTLHTPCRSRRCSTIAETLTRPCAHRTKPRDCSGTGRRSFWPSDCLNVRMDDSASMTCLTAVSVLVSDSAGSSRLPHDSAVCGAARPAARGLFFRIAARH
jgi:hypothetical protein